MAPPIRTPPSAHRISAHRQTRFRSFKWKPAATPQIWVVRAAVRLISLRVLVPAIITGLLTNIYATAPWMRTPSTRWHIKFSHPEQFRRFGRRSITACGQDLLLRELRGAPPCRDDDDGRHGSDS